MSATKRINGHNLPQAMAERVTELKRNGSLVFLAMPDFGLEETGPCKNCYGTGQLQMQFAVGGPYDNPQSGGSKTAVSYHNGKYYALKTEVYYCPDCSIRSARGR